MPARVVNLASRTDPLAALVELGDRLLAMSRPRLAAYLAGCRPDRRNLCEYALGAVGAHWRQDPSTMLEHFNAGRYDRHRLARFLGAAFRRAADGTETRQVWNVASRLGKSELASKAGPAWALDRDPTSTFILSSYAYQLAVENAIGCRDLLRAHPGELRVRLRRDKNRQDRWATTEGGGLLAAGVGGSVIGFGAGGGSMGAGGGVIIDDPYKNWVDAHSALKRQQLWDFYLSVLRLRLDSERAFILAVMARWHVDDIVGRLKAADAAGTGDRFTVYALPSLATRADDLLGRALGEPLVPTRFDKAAVDARIRALGSYLAAAMEQQEPSPEEGNEVLRSWWQWADRPTARPDDALTSWDMKMKDITHGDFVVGQAWHRYASTAWCMEQMRGQWNVATTRVAMALMSVRHPRINRHVVENTGNGPEVIAALRRGIPRAKVDDAIAGLLAMSRDEREQVERLLQRGIPGIVAVDPVGDKSARLRAVAPFIEAGDVFLPDEPAVVMGWGLSLVNEAAAFPNDEHDDQVDAMSQGLSMLLAHPVGSIVVPPAGRVAAPRASRVVGPRPSLSRARH